MLAKKLPFPEAVTQAVDYCILNGILADFLSRNRAEAIAMSIFEYNEEEYLKSEREVWRSEGIAQGIQQGIERGLEEGENRFSKLLQMLKEAGRNEDLDRVISDRAYRERLYRENHI